MNQPSTNTHSWHSWMSSAATLKMCDCWFAGRTVSLESASDSVLFFLCLFLGRFLRIFWQTNRQTTGSSYLNKTCGLWRTNRTFVSLHFPIFKTVIHYLLRCEMQSDDVCAVSLISVRRGCVQAPQQSVGYSRLHLRWLPALTVLEILRRHRRRSPYCQCWAPIKASHST